MAMPRVYFWSLTRARGIFNCMNPPFSRYIYSTVSTGKLSQALAPFNYAVLSLSVNSTSRDLQSRVILMYVPRDSPQKHEHASRTHLHHCFTLVISEPCRCIEHPLCNATRLSTNNIDTLGSSFSEPDWTSIVHSKVDANLTSLPTRFQGDEDVLDASVI